MAEGVTRAALYTRLLTGLWKVGTVSVHIRFDSDHSPL
jgi:hypothetical protein